MKYKPYPYYKAPQLKDLRELIDFCETTYSEQIAFRWLEKKSEKSKTYKEFKADIEALGTYFISKGYSRTHIAILSENSYEWIVTFFAVVNSNNIIVPLDKEATVDDLKSIFETSDSTVLVYSDTYSDEASAINCKEMHNLKDFDRLIAEGNQLIVNGDNSYKTTSLDREDCCAIFYTSGTTSEPKGAMLSHKGFASDAVYTQMNSTVPDSSMLVLPLHHTYAIILGLSVPMLVGSSIFLNKSLRNLMSDMKYSQPKYMAIVPLMLELFYKKIIEALKESDKKELIDKLISISNIARCWGLDLRKKFFAKIIDSFGGQLELLAVGGAPINSDMVVYLTNIGIQVLCGYGTTECSPIVSSVRNKHFMPTSSGAIIPNTYARTVDGEIQIKGDIVFLGYYKNEEATKEVFDGEWYKTGDLGELKNNYIYITGRCKNLIILSNGENVSPENIEMLLTNQIPEIEEIVVYGEDDVIVAEIYNSQITDELKTVITQKIDKYNTIVPMYKRISKTKFRDVPFEKTTTKKIKRANIGGKSNA